MSKTDMDGQRLLDFYSAVHEILLEQRLAGDDISDTAVANSILRLTEALIASERQAAAIEENERYLEMLKTGNWRSFATEVTERLEELRNK